MILGIDASNIRSGGGVTHLAEVLRAAQPESSGFSRIVVWSGRATLDQLVDRPWLSKRHLGSLDGNLFRRAVWQRWSLSAAAREAGCDVLFIPGGTFAGSFQPVVTLSQNLLPFEWAELRRYGLSWLALKFAMLRIAQGRTFQRASGLIFLTEYARKVVLRAVRSTRGSVTVIPHGIDPRFRTSPRRPIDLTECSDARPIRILYVSIVDVYKHQWCVAEAVVRLRQEGLPVVLELIGDAYPPALRRLSQTLEQLGPQARCVRYLGPIPFDGLHERYAAADVFVFASSCENLPNILIEAMAAGLPIACSSRGPMPEVLGDAGTYFDPENPADIADVLRTLITTPTLRAEKSRLAFERAKAFSWERCAAATLGFIKEVADGYRRAS